MSSYFIVVEEIFHAKSQDCDEKWHYVRPKGVPLETGVVPTISQVSCISGSLCDRSESVPDMCAKCIEPPNCCQIRKLNQICHSLNRKHDQNNCHLIKGQLNLKGIFGVFKSIISNEIFYKDFFPSLQKQVESKNKALYYQGLFHIIDRVLK